MEATEISVLMLITCVSGTLLYSRDSPVGSLALPCTQVITDGNSGRNRRFPDHYVATWTEIRRSYEPCDYGKLLLVG